VPSLLKTAGSSLDVLTAGLLAGMRDVVLAFFYKGKIMEVTGKLESALNATSSALNVSAEQGSLGQGVLKPQANPIERPALGRIASSAHQAVDKITQAANQAVETLGEKSKQVKETQIELNDIFRHYVKEHPGTSVGIAVASGFLIRHLLSLR
jgi:ElaB/YqjD/DUF883 family membrane-anchored ribosome-binding protein